MPLEITNTSAITAIQFDVILPEGIAAFNENGQISISLSSDRATSSHYLSTSFISANHIRAIAFSDNNAAFNGSEGTIATLMVKAEGYSSSPAVIQIKDIIIVTADKKEIAVNNIESSLTVNDCIMGDANMSGTVTISDVVTAINYALELDPAPFNLAAADMNGDGEITIIDIVKIVNIIMNPAQSTRSYKRGEAAAASESIKAEAEASVVTMTLDDNSPYTALMMDVELPASATLVSASAGDDHTVAWNAIGENRVRIIAYSLDNAPFPADALLSLEIDGEGTVTAESIIAVTAEGTETAIGGSSVDVNGTTGIGSTDEEIVSVRYFTEAGVELKEPQQGINIVVTQYADGKIESKKVVMKK